MNDIYNEHGYSDLKSYEDMLFKYFELINTKQHLSLIDYYNQLSDEDVVSFWDSIREDGIYTHQPPFYDNITFEMLKNLYKEFDITPYKFDGIKTPLIMGDSYIIVLKHHPMTKFSARSVDFLNLKGIPSRTKGYSEGTQPYSTTPIKIGEMEVNNLILSNDMEEVVRLLEHYSTNEESRQTMIKTLLSDNIFNLEKIKSELTTNKTGQILNVYLKSIGLSLDGMDSDELEAIDLNDLIE